MTTEITYFNNAPLFCRPRLPLLLTCLETATDEILAAHGRHLKVWVTTGPGCLSRAYVEALARGDAPRTLIIDDWFNWSEVVKCAYKDTWRHWLHHDDGRPWWVGIPVRATLRAWARAVLHRSTP